MVIYNETMVIGTLFKNIVNINDEETAYAFTLQGETWMYNKKLLQMMGYQMMSLVGALPLAEIHC